MTPTEKATKAIDEGFQWLLAFVAMRLGEEKSPSYELRSAASEARKAAWAAMSAYGRFKALASGDDPDAEGRQQALPGTRAVTVPEPSPKVVALVEAIDAAVDKAIADTFGDIPDEGQGEGQGEEPDAELDQVEGELATELDRVLVDGEALHAHAERSGSALLINVGSPYGAVDATTWEIVREAPRVLGALRQLPDSAGAEAVRAVLCGLEETPKAMPTDEDVARITEAIGGVVPGASEDFEPGCEDDADCTTHDCANCNGPGATDKLERAESVIGAELTRLGADGVEVEADYSAEVPPVVRVHLRSTEWDTLMTAAEVLDALRLLPDDCGEAVVKARLLHGPEEAEAMQKAEAVGVLDARKELDRCGATEIAIDSIGDDGLTLYLRRLGRGHGERCELTAAQVLEALSGQVTNCGTAQAWAALRGKVELPGRPAGEPAKRRKAKAKPAPAPAAAAYYDEPGRKFTGD